MERCSTTGPEASIEPGSYPSNEEWLEGFRSQAQALRIPLSGMIEITSRCNLRCVHCYLGDQSQQHSKRDLELTTRQWLDLIDELAAAGCLFLTITGGDPMMRRDFPQIYRHAKERGILTTVFCDGVLVTDKIVELFRELPPNQVEVSLYGASQETYETITQVEGSHAKCLRGVRELLDNGIRTSLKTVHMSLNTNEVQEMERMAVEDFGVDFRIDAAIFPCLPSDTAGAEADRPMELRVTPERAIEVEMSSVQRLEDWAKYYETKKDVPTVDGLYSCGAAVTGFYIDPFGNMSPCLMTTNYRYSLKGRSFYELWHEELPKIRESKAREDSGFGCNTCSIRAACTGCSAFHQLETGFEDVRSEYVCSQTQLRHEKIVSFIGIRDRTAGAD